MELIKLFTGQEYASGLEAWAWIGLHGQTPVFTSLFGDVFLQSADGWWYLDTIAGDLTRPWSTRESMMAELATEDGQDEYLRGVFAMAADRRGMHLRPNEVYAFAPPPMIAGFDIANIAAYDFVAALNIAGQLHDQTRHMPPGTPITGIRVDSDAVDTS